MKASAMEFRLRFWILCGIYLLGFMAPWNWALHLDGAGPNAHVWGRLAVALSRGGTMGLMTAFNVVLVAGTVLAFAGAALRTWGSAYLGVDVMRDESLRSDAVVAEGPYRRMRNPLYVGLWLHTLALALLMPVSGAVFAVVAVVLFQLRLMLAEEAFLTQKLGAAYVAYCQQVPRIVPALRPKAGDAGLRPRWGHAVLAEIYLWGVAGCFATLGWKYNAALLIRGVLISLGVSLVLRGVVAEPGKKMLKTEESDKA